MNAHQLRQLLDNATESSTTVWTWDECFSVQSDILLNVPFEDYKEILNTRLDIMCARALRAFGRPVFTEE